MTILILGGTSFVGRHIVNEALKQGHTITLAHRGQTNADLFPDCEHLHFDRLGEWPDLGDRSWDAVVDSSAYVPRALTLAAAALQGRTERYLFISTISVYDVTGQATLDESSPVFAELETDTETIDSQSYGPLKVACERVGREAWGEKFVIIRPGIVVGRWDPTNRFEYWVRQVAAGGEVPVPERLDQPVQYVDGGDLARLCLARLAGPGGVWNGAGDETTFGAMLEGIRVALGVEATWVPTATEALDKSPMVLPSDGSRDAIFRCSSERAKAAGLVHRPLADIVADVLELT